MFRKRILLFVRPGGIGDIICSFPALIALRERDPDAIIIYSAYWHYRHIVQQGRVADYVVGCDSNPVFPKFIKEDFDYYYQPRFAEESGRPHEVAHLIDDYCEQVGVTPKSRSPRLYVPEKIQARARKTLQPFRSKSKLVIGFCVGRTWPIREWSDANWTALVEMLKKNLDCSVLQLGTDAARSTHIPGTSYYVDKFDLAELTGVIEQLDLFIGIDSGPMHIATAVDTPCVGMFGPVDPEKRVAPGARTIAITAQIPCLGCHHREPRIHWVDNCENDSICMKLITPETVFTAAMKFLESGEVPSLAVATPT